MENLRNYFFDPMEKELSVLGEGYLSELIRVGYSSKAYAILTNKRLYISGRYFDSGNGYSFAASDNLSLSLGTIYSMDKVKKPYLIYTILLILSACVAVIFLPSLIYFLYSIIKPQLAVNLSDGILSLAAIVLVPSVMLTLFKLHKRELLVIKYNEGEVGLPLKYYTTGELNHFLEDFKLAKDEQSFEEQSAAPARDYNSIADELSKYKDMLDRGLIDEDEYRVLKNRLIKLPAGF